MARYPALVPLRWSDMDAYGHVNNVQFLTYVEEARIDMLRPLSRRVPGEPVVQGIVVAHSEISYRRPLVHRHEPVPIDVWVTKIGGASFDLAYEVHDEEGVVYAMASSTMVPYDFSVERPRRLTALEREFLTGYREPAGG